MSHRGREAITLRVHNEGSGEWPCAFKPRAMLKRLFQHDARSIASER